MTFLCNSCCPCLQVMISGVIQSGDRPDVEESVSKKLVVEDQYQPRKTLRKGWSFGRAGFLAW